MRKTAIVALRLALSMSQAGVVGSCVTPTYVSAEAGNLYFDESDPELLPEVLSEDMVSIGYAIKDGCKYVYEYNGKYYASESVELDGEEEKYDACVFKKEYSSLEDAEKAAQEIKKGLPVFINLKVLNLENVSQLSNVKLSIYRGSDKVKTVTLDRLDLVSGTDDSLDSNTSSDNSNISNPKADGKVSVSVDKVTVKEKDVGKQVNKVSVSWDLKNDNAVNFIIEGTGDTTPIDSAKGKVTVKVTLYNGSYNYLLNAESGKVYKGKIKIANKYMDARKYLEEDKNSKTKKEYLAKDEPAPKLTLSEIPKRKNIGQSFDLTISSNEEATITFNGKVSDGYVKKAKFNIIRNGEYPYSAINKSGKETIGVIKINCFKNLTSDRNSFWSGNTIGGKTVSVVKRLVQTGMYDTKMLVVAAVLGISGVVTLGYEFYKKRRKGGSNAKNS